MYAHAPALNGLNVYHCFDLIEKQNKNKNNANDLMRRSNRTLSFYANELNFLNEIDYSYMLLFFCECNKMKFIY